MKAPQLGPAGKSILASYSGFMVGMAVALVSVPLAVAYLPKNQIGLWLIVSQMMNYLRWLDLGLSSAVGRKLAAPISSGDEEEVDKWWTMAAISLGALGLLVCVIGSALHPFLVQFLKISLDLKADFDLVWFTLVFLTGITFLLKIIPGLMIAQDRFHWVALGHAVSPLIQLLVFYLALSKGFGLRAYVIASCVVQGTLIIYSVILYRTGPYIPCWNWKGVDKSRAKALFSYSSKFSLVGLMELLFVSAPGLIIGRLGSLADVPRYEFSAKASSLVAGLVRKTLQAFHPGLVLLYVKEDWVEFRTKVTKVVTLLLSLSFLGSGICVLGTRAFVELIAGPEFFIGNLGLLWFAVGVFVTPSLGFSLSLLQCLGDVGRCGFVGILVGLTSCAVAGFAYEIGGVNWLGAPIILGLLTYVFYLYRFISSKAKIDLGLLLNRHFKTYFLGLFLVVFGCGLMVLAAGDGPLAMGGSRRLSMPTLLEFLSGLPLIIGGLFQNRHYWSCSRSVGPKPNEAKY